MNETVKFWTKLLANPLRLLAVIVVLAVIWINAGWILHPIHSSVMLVGSAVIIIAISAFIARAGFFKKINWASSRHQRIATRYTVAICLLVVLYYSWGYKHTIIYTLVGAVIIAVASKDVIKNFFK